MANSRPQTNRGQKQRTKSIYTTEYERFVVRFVEARKAAGLTQEQVAERVNQTQAFVSRCERGQRRLDIVELRMFLGAFGVDFAEFVIAFDKEITANRTAEAVK